MCHLEEFRSDNHFELVQIGAVKAAALYSEHLDRVYSALPTRYPATLMKRKLAMLPQHGNPPAHTVAALFKAKIKALPGIAFLLRHPRYSPDLAPPSDGYHLLRSMAHFFRLGRTFDSLEIVLEYGCC